MDTSNPSSTTQAPTPTKQHDLPLQTTHDTTHQLKINVATSDAMSSIAPKKSKYALDTGLIALPADIRLEVYKAAFPEINRVKARQRPSENEVPIHCIEEYISTTEYFRGIFFENGIRHCPTCTAARKDKLRIALKSHFARDPTIHEEFLKHYLALVQFSWQQLPNEVYCSVIRALPRFLDMLFKSNMAGNFKHLHLQIAWDYTGFRVFEHRLCESYFAHDVLRCARIFGMLHKVKIKAELTFGMTTSTRVLFLKRIEELCKMHLKLDGPHFWAAWSDLRDFAITLDFVEVGKLMLLLL
jgi:hypothetical protein